MGKGQFVIRPITVRIDVRSRNGRRGFRPESEGLKKLRGLFVIGLASVMVLAMAIVGSSGARAYNNQIQWQIGFSGTFTNVSGGPGTSGFWGWCVFGGSNGGTTVGTVGTVANCVLTEYFGVGPGFTANTFNIQFDVNKWSINGTTAFPIPGVSAYFVLLGGSVRAEGPGPKAMGIPTGVQFPLLPVCASMERTGSLLGTLCDTGIPAVPGHIAFQGFMFGAHVAVVVQVTKLS